MREEPCEVRRQIGRHRVVEPGDGEEVEGRRAGTADVLCGVAEKAGEVGGREEAAGEQALDPFRLRHVGQLIAEYVPTQGIEAASERLRCLVGQADDADAVESFGHVGVCPLAD